MAQRTHDDGQKKGSLRARSGKVMQSSPLMRSIRSAVAGVFPSAPQGAPLGGSASPSPSGAPVSQGDLEFLSGMGLESADLRRVTEILGAAHSEMSGHSRPLAFNPLHMSAARKVVVAQGDQRGVALLELMLVMGIISAVLGAIFMTYRYAETRREAAAQVQNVSAVATNLNRLGIVSGDFTGLTTSQAVQDGIFPNRMVDAAGAVSTRWGAVRVDPFSLSGSSPGDAAVVTYETVPSRFCNGFVSGAAKGFTSVRINGEFVKQNGGATSVPGVIRLCDASATSKVELIMARQGGTGMTLGELKECAPQAPETETLECPPLQGGEIVRTRSFTCVNKFDMPYASPWSTVSNNCAPLCAPQVPSPSFEEDSQNQVATRSKACTPLQIGEIIEKQPQVRTRTRHWTCPAEVGDPVLGNWGAYSAWEGTAPWSLKEDNCVPLCAPTLPSPNPEVVVESKTVTDTSLQCPAGWEGEIKRTRTEIRTQTTTYSCPAQTGPYTTSMAPFTPYAAAPGPAGQWKVESNTCQKVCVQPDPVTTTETFTGTCDSGQVTHSTGQSTFTQARTKTRNWTCPSRYAEPVEVEPTYSPMTPDKATACGPQCVKPADVETTETQSVGCPAGSLFYPSGASGFTQTRTKTQSYACASYTSPLQTLEPTYTPYLPAVSQACAPVCTPRAPTETVESQMVACPTGQVTISGGYASFSQTRINVVNWSCPSTFATIVGTPAPPAAFSPSVSSTCAPVCTPRSPDVTNITQTASCPSGQAVLATNGATTSFTQTITRTTPYLCKNPTGPATAQPYTDSAASPTIAEACAPVCVPPSPVPTPVSSPANCPAGTLTVDGKSSFIQTAVKTTNYTCPTRFGAPVATESTSPLMPTIAATCQPVCVAPPPAAPLVQTVSRPVSCPSGLVTSSGSSMFTQTATQTTTYENKCPGFTGGYTTTYQTTVTPYGPDASEVCAAACVPKSPYNRFETETVNCAPGRINKVSFGPTFVRQRTVTTNYTCAIKNAPAQPVVPDVNGAWDTTESLSCAPICVPGTPPAPVTAPFSQTVSCPPGQRTPSGTTSFAQSGFKTTNYTNSCTSPAGSVTTDSSFTLSSMTPDVATFCAPACVYRAPEQSTVTETVPCNAGRLNKVDYGATFVRTATKTQNFTCSSPNAPATPSTSSTGSWSTTEAVACAPQCVLPAQPYREFQQGAFSSYSEVSACPAGQNFGGQFRSWRLYPRVSQTAYCLSPVSPLAWSAPVPIAPDEVETGRVSTCATSCQSFLSAMPQTKYVSHQYQTSFRSSATACPSGSPTTSGNEDFRVVLLKAEKTFLCLSPTVLGSSTVYTPVQTVQDWTKTPTSCQACPSGGSSFSYSPGTAGPPPVSCPAGTYAFIPKAGSFYAPASSPSSVQAQAYWSGMTDTSYVVDMTIKYPVCVSTPTGYAWNYPGAGSISFPSVPAPSPLPEDVSVCRPLPAM